MKSVTQDWVHGLTLMQQSVLLSSVRGPDGIAKYGAVKMMIRWYRRCILITAFDGIVFTDPGEEGGGSFTGPSYVWNPRPWQDNMDSVVFDYMKSTDGLPHHYNTHFMHSCEILGYKHPEEEIRQWWYNLYLRIVHSMHMHPETELEMDARLGDSKVGWLERADEATVK